jgi:tetratricopeptide (TPR) repeat protein
LKTTHKNHFSDQISKALAAQKLGRLAEAEKLYLEVLKDDPLNFDALHMLGVASAQQNLLPRAISLIQNAIVLKPNHATAYFNLANVFKTANNIELAIQHFLTATKLNPAYLDAWINLGTLKLDHKDFNGALDCFKKAIEINPSHLRAHLGLGRVHNALNQLDSAIQSYEKALQLNASQENDIDSLFDTYIDIGTAFNSLGQAKKGLAAFNKILSINPNHQKALFYKGIAYREMGKNTEALEAFNALYQQNCTDIKAIHALAITFIDINHNEEALICCKRVLELSPNLAAAHDTMGVILNNLKDLHNSILHHLKAIELNPLDPSFYMNLGNSLLSVNQITEAKIAFAEASRLDPSSFKARWNMSNVLLKSADLTNGWSDYKMRWKIPSLKLKALETNKPEWLPSADCKHLLVWGEQGVGDEIMFACLLKQVISSVPKVTVFLDPRLIPMLQRSFPELACISSVAELNSLDYDHHISIGTLPQIFCRSMKDLQKIYSPYLMPNQELSNTISQSHKTPGKILCGISWKSNNSKLGADRSINLKDLISSLSIPEMDFINLQYGDVVDDIAEVKNHLGINIIQADEIDNFSNLDGLASLINACDLVISIDNTTVHLSGALGKPVWILLNTNPDWRWFLGRTESPWYPSATLFRQSTPGQWKDVLAAVKKLLLTSTSQQSLNTDTQLKF